MGGNVGLDSQLGIATEVGGYGTFTVPTDFVEFDTEGLALTINKTESSGLRAGRIMAPVDRHKATTRSVAGDIALKVPNKGFGEILNLLHGESVGPVQVGASAAFKQTHNIGSSRPNGKSLTIQVGKGQSGASGVVKPHSYLGCKFTQVVFSVETGGDLTCSLSVDGRDEDTSEALATASYPSDIGSYTFVDGEVTIAGVTPSLFSNFNLTLPLPLATERYGLQRSALKSEPLLNDYVRPTLSFQAEYQDDTLYDHYLNDDEVAVIADFQGDEIDAGNNEQIKFTASACKITGATPPVGGPGILTIETPAELFDNGADEPLIIEYVSTDSSIDS